MLICCGGVRRRLRPMRNRRLVGIRRPISVYKEAKGGLRPPADFGYRLIRDGGGLIESCERRIGEHRRAITAAREDIG